MPFLKKQKSNLLARKEESQRVIGGKDNEDKGSHSLLNLNWLRTQHLF